VARTPDLRHPHPHVGLPAGSQRAEHLIMEQHFLKTLAVAELRDDACRATPSALTKSRRKGDGSLTTSCSAITKVLSLIQTLMTDAFTRLHYLDASADKA
jgi:hypothetical protein